MAGKGKQPATQQELLDDESTAPKRTRAPKGILVRRGTFGEVTGQQDANSSDESSTHGNPPSRSTTSASSHSWTSAPSFSTASGLRGSPTRDPTDSTTSGPRPSMLDVGTEPVNTKYDATKSASIHESDLHQPPDESSPVVKIKFMGPNIGYRVFAARNIKKDEYIFVDNHLMQAKFDVAKPMDEASFEPQRDAFNRAMRDHLGTFQFAYPQLAVLHGSISYDHEEVIRGLESTFPNVQVQISKEDEEKHTAYLEASRTNRGEIIIQKFFRDYSFSPESGLNPPRAGSPAKLAGLAPVGEPSRPITTVYTYRLASLLGHCCPTSKAEAKANDKDWPNCDHHVGKTRWAKFVGDNQLVIRAKRDIKEDEELTIYFPSRGKECIQCRNPVVTLAARAIKSLSPVLKK